MAHGRLRTLPIQFIDNDGATLGPAVRQQSESIAELAQFERKKSQSPYTSSHCGCLFPEP